MADPRFASQGFDLGNPGHTPGTVLPGAQTLSQTDAIVLARVQELEARLEESVETTNALRAEVVSLTAEVEKLHIICTDLLKRDASSRGREPARGRDQRQPTPFSGPHA